MFEVIKDKNTCIPTGQQQYKHCSMA